MAAKAHRESAPASPRALRYRDSEELRLLSRESAREARVQSARVRWRRASAGAPWSFRRVRMWPLLGPLRLVPPAPPEVGIPLHHPLELEDSVNERFRAGRAARHVDVYGQELVGSANERVVVENAGARSACAHRDH